MFFSCQLSVVSFQLKFYSINSIYSFYSIYSLLAPDEDREADGEIKQHQLGIGVAGDIGAGAFQLTDDALDIALVDKRRETG